MSSKQNCRPVVFTSDCYRTSALVINQKSSILCSAYCVFFRFCRQTVQNVNAQSYMIAKDSNSKRKWLFKKGIGLFFVNHICNTLLLQLSPFLLEILKTPSKCWDQCNTSDKKYTMSSDHKSFKIRRSWFLQLFKIFEYIKG